jgi:hypothetical protein
MPTAAIAIAVFMVTACKEGNLAAEYSRSAAVAIVT